MIISFLCNIAFRSLIIFFSLFLVFFYIVCFCYALCYLLCNNEKAIDKLEDMLNNGMKQQKSGEGSNGGGKGKSSMFGPKEYVQIYTYVQ